MAGTEDYRGELRRRRRRYEREARAIRYADAWQRLFHTLLFRASPRLGRRERKTVVVIAVPVLAGLTVGLVYTALDRPGVGALALGVGVTVGLWLLAAAAAVLRRLGRSESGRMPPPPASGGGYGGVREPRRPPSNPGAMSVELPEPIGGDD